MMRDEPFDRLSGDQRIIAELVLRAAREECDGDRCLVAPVLKECVAASVKELGAPKVMSHVHVFALRRVKECIRAGTCNIPPA